MKFKGHGIVWNKDIDKPLCEFTNGAFETEDPKIYQKLVSLGYEHEGDFLDPTAIGDAGEQKLIEGQKEPEPKKEEKPKAPRKTRGSK